MAEGPAPWLVLFACASPGGSFAFVLHAPSHTPTPGARVQPKGRTGRALPGRHRSARARAFLPGVPDWQGMAFVAPPAKLQATNPCNAFCWQQNSVGRTLTGASRGKNRD